MRKLPLAVRWLHTYLSLLGFAAALFFSATGLFLNHAARFEGEMPRLAEREGTMPPEVVPAAGGSLAAAVDWLRERHSLRGSLAESRLSASGGTLAFKGPAFSAEVEFELPSGRYRVRTESMGLVALLDDLHKGRDSGNGWSWLIDASAAVMALSSVTGLWLLLYLKKRRGAGLWTAAVGAAALFAVYFAFVP
ncbi:MAG: PepSY-associated TM helix domain-containing protein [Planctomycetota bacterium]